MRITARHWCMMLFVGSLTTSTAQTGGVVFNNWGSASAGGPAWAAPWFGPGSNDVVLFDNPVPTFGFRVGNARLAGSGYTAELWGGRSESTLEFLARRNFSTVPALYGCLSSPITAPIPFAVPGERVFLQLRAYDNQGGAITSWTQVAPAHGILYGWSETFLSPPLDTVANPPVALTGEGMKAHCVSVDGSLGSMSLPILAMRIRDSFYIDRWAASRFPVFEGETATLSIVVPNPADYIQWRFQGLDIPGATNQSLALTNIQLSQGGTYSAVTRVVGVGTIPLWGTNSFEVPVRPLRLTEPRVAASGAFSARIEGSTNRAVIVEASTNLLSWTAVQTQWLGGYFPPSWCTGCVLGLTFSNPPPVAGSARFHRLRAVP